MREATKTEINNEFNGDRPPKKHKVGDTEVQISRHDRGYSLMRVNVGHFPTRWHIVTPGSHVYPFTSSGDGSRIYMDGRRYHGYSPLELFRNVVYGEITQKERIQGAKNIAVKLQGLGEHLADLLDDDDEEEHQILNAYDRVVDHVDAIVDGRA